MDKLLYQITGNTNDLFFVDGERNMLGTRFVICECDDPEKNETLDITVTSVDNSRQHEMFRDLVNKEVTVMIFETDKRIDDWGYVDLDLPSGLLWAKCNIGASKETEAGLYFAWGDTNGYAFLSPKKLFKYEDYIFQTNINVSYLSPCKYNKADKLTTLRPCDDAATANVGYPKRMPTKEEFKELIENTYNEWYMIDGVNGYKFTSKKDPSKYVFFPAVGELCGGAFWEFGTFGGVWSSSIFESSPSKCYGQYGSYMRFVEKDVCVSCEYRHYGMNVRAVIGSNKLSK